MDDFDDYLESLASPPVKATTAISASANDGNDAKKAVTCTTGNSVYDLDFLNDSPMAASSAAESTSTAATSANGASIYPNDTADTDKKVDTSMESLDALMNSLQPSSDGHADTTPTTATGNSIDTTNMNDLSADISNFIISTPSPVPQPSNINTNVHADHSNETANSLDEFAEFLDSSPGGFKDVAKEIDAELTEFLSEDTPAVDRTDPQPPPSSTTSAQPAQSTASTLPTKNAGGVDDFLSWLEESPTNKPPTQTTSSPSSSSGTKILNLTSLKASVAGGNNSSVNNFFDEVFGDSGSEGDSEDEATPLDMLANTQEPIIVDIQAEIVATVESSFPDVDRLRKILLSAGYIPEDLRGKVWCLLLNGFYVEDAEAKEFKASRDSGSTDMKDDCDLVVNSTIGTDHAPADPSTSRDDLFDLLVLYCQRNNVEYDQTMCHILTPLLISSNRMPRGLAYSCFYPLCSKFMPLMRLLSDSGAMRRAVSKLSEWLRLLVVYHFPALALHLDRVVPGWEKPASKLSVTESRRRESQAAMERGLDDLEAEMGFDTLGGSTTSSSSSFTSTVIDSSRTTKDVSENNQGLIPMNWICGIFAGSVPPDMTCNVWDWVLLHNDRFAGLYLTATLLGIFSTELLSMSGSEVQAWLRKTAAGTDNWYRLGGSSSHPEITWSQFVRGWMYGTEALEKNTPASFVRAINDTEEWATSLSYTLEQESKNADNDGPNFMATNDSTHGSLDNEVHSNHHSQHSGTVSVSECEIPSSPPYYMKQQQHSEDTNAKAGNKAVDGDAVVEVIERLGLNKEGPKMQKMLEIQRQAQEVAKEKYAQMKELAKEQAKYWVNAGGEGGLNVFGPDVGSDSNNGNATPSTPNSKPQLKIRTSILPGESKWLHDNLRKSVCLWTDAGEVVPCLCSNRRKPTAEKVNNILAQYKDGVTMGDNDVDHTGIDHHINASSQVVFPQSNHATKGIEAPFFFGIDCRSEEEKVLGRFPKAFDMNADFIVDNEEVSMLLETLQPLANSVHLCIIGAGDAAVRNRTRREYASKRSLWDFATLDEKEKEKTRLQEEQEIERVVEEDLAKLNGAAMFFIKRGFSKVSILHGGFMNAARYLLRDDSSLNMDNALVDVDERSIYNILSPTSKEKMGIPQAMVNTVGEENLNKMTSFFQSMGAKIQAGVDTTISSGGTNTPDSSCIENGNHTIGNDKPMLKAASGVFRKMSLFGSSIIEKSKETFSRRDSGNNIAVNGNPNGQRNSVFASQQASSTAVSSLSFVIDDDEDEDDDTMKSTHGVSVQKSGLEKKQALAMHRLTGITAGEEIKISKDCLPGAVLFPAFVVQSHDAKSPSSDASTSSPLPSTSVQANPTDTPSAISPPPSGLEVPSSSPSIMSPPADLKALKKSDHRYLVITRDRFIVLNSGGDGVGATATVCSNNHLTDLIKMTFRKKDPDLVNLFFRTSVEEDDGAEQKVGQGDSDIGQEGQDRQQQQQAMALRTRPFRIAKRKEFIEVLQKNMQRFK